MPYAIGLGSRHLHLMMPLHIMHSSSDIPPSPPVHIDLAYFPGQILASSKLFPCCTEQYLQCLLNLSTLSLPLWHLDSFPSLVGDAPPTVVPPTTKLPQVAAMCLVLVAVAWVKSCTTWVRCIAGNEFLAHCWPYSTLLFWTVPLSFGIKLCAIHFIDSTNMPIQFEGGRTTCGTLTCK